jgi:hypothetical protein
MRNILLILLSLPLIHAYAASDSLAEREVLSSALNKDLLCNAGNGKDRAGDPESNSFLTKVGASITTDDNADYNQFRYSFITPLEVNSLSLYSVQQMVGEGGVIFIAEVKGDLPGFAGKLKAQPAKEDDDFLGVSNVLFYKIIKEKTTPDSEPEFTKIVVGQNLIQKVQGRFFYGCIETMDLG